MKNTWTELTPGILEQNILSLRRVLGGDTDIIFVVKANAYGHGLREVAGVAHRAGVNRFAVAHVEEAVELRELLPSAEILIVCVLSPGDALTAVSGNLVPVIVSTAHARALADAAHSQGQVLRCHAKIDTGMGRVGFPWESAAEQICDLVEHPGLEICGMCSHFASSWRADRSLSDLQADRFRSVVRSCEELGYRVPFRHISNSAGTWRCADWDFDAVRPGILLYGYPQRESDTQRAGQEGTIEVRPVLQWKTRLVQVKRVPQGFAVSYDGTYVTDRETHIGTINVGYSDGYPRVLSNRGVVLVSGRRVPVVGRVTMNLTLVDLGPETDAQPGDEAVLLGTQQSEALWAEELAGLAGTISYEILTNIRTTDRRVVDVARAARGTSG